MWDGGRLNFQLLQRRMARRHGPAIHAAAREHPATFVAFDMLAVGGEDLRRQPLRSRRARLERVSARWAPPMELSPMTTDEAEARQWFEDYRPAGIEGIVAKAANGVYEPGRRTWIKVKSRETAEVIAGAVIGPLHRPTGLVAGLVGDGRLVIAGRTTELSAAHSVELADAIADLGDAGGHPWPAQIASSAFGQRGKVPITRIQPIVVAEVSADSAFDGARFRHPLRFVRIRPDLAAADVEPVLG